MGDGEDGLEAAEVDADGDGVEGVRGLLWLWFWLLHFFAMRCLI